MQKPTSIWDTAQWEKDLLFSPVSLRQSLSWVLAAGPVTCGIWPPDGRHKNASLFRQNHFWTPGEILEKNACQTQQGLWMKITHVLIITVQDLHLSSLMQYAETGFSQRIPSWYALLRLDCSLLAQLIQSLHFQTPCPTTLRRSLKQTSFRIASATE